MRYKKKKWQIVSAALAAMIARLLGHKRLNNVQHYRKMSNQRMADETREVRQMMSDIIYMSLAGWGEEYEQIRQDD